MKIELLCSTPHCSNLVEEEPADAKRPLSKLRATVRYCAECIARADQAQQPKLPGM